MLDDIFLQQASESICSTFRNKHYYVACLELNLIECRSDAMTHLLDCYFSLCGLKVKWSNLESKLAQII